ncbi:MAG TPA: L-arabinose isomerase [Thermoanaerobaculia bacterium]|nr:L-arabinose isomerase [Thermoanaerobaculia bacterium]
MIDLSRQEVWLVTGSQHLYGEQALRQVAEHAAEVARELDGSPAIPVRVKNAPVVTTADAAREVCAAASREPACVGVVTWMHTFSPARMWIGGLQVLDRPLAHLHTQFQRDLPWSTIDMDYMNLHQSAHGGREFGHVCSRLGIARKVVVGHWRDPGVQGRLGAWSRAACARADGRRARVARFGDNMRQVAVTEGDKVEAQIRFGTAVDGWGVGDLVARVGAVGDDTIDALVGEYDDAYEVAEELRAGGERRDDLREAARIELGLRGFLEEGGLVAFTDTFEDLHGLRQLPGIAAQRLMADGYGFAAEGDWKTAALVRALKVMSSGLEGGASFMEDYTYHLEPGRERVLGAHMLEICPSIAAARARAEIHPLAIGGRGDPVRLVFDAAPGPAINVALVDLGSRFRVLSNEVDLVAPDHPLPRLPVARAVWVPRPDLATAAAAWIHAGGPHHTALSPALRVEHVEDWARMCGVELLSIDRETTVRAIERELKLSDAAWPAGRGHG